MVNSPPVVINGLILGGCGSGMGNSPINYVHALGYKAIRMHITT